MNNCYKIAKFTTLSFIGIGAVFAGFSSGLFFQPILGSFIFIVILSSMYRSYWIDVVCPQCKKKCAGECLESRESEQELHYYYYYGCRFCGHQWEVHERDRGLD
jgi:hypothetical protein